MTSDRDHGGGIDAAAREFGGTRADWLDLSTGINPTPYPFAPTTPDAWTALPDRNAEAAITDAARRFWSVPDNVGILPVPGASAAIAQIPRLAPPGSVWIPKPTYNEHAAAFGANGWTVTNEAQGATAQVLVHPNNPTGQLWDQADLQTPLRVIDESFCDVTPDRSLMHHASSPGTLILKSFGKFWGLAGLRLGFVIGNTKMLARLSEMLGPWAVAGPALDIGTQALNDAAWADRTRQELRRDAQRLDHMMTNHGANVAGGTDLFRLYSVNDAAAWQRRLAEQHIWTRIFPYSDTWLRLGLPGEAGWARLERAL